MFSNVPLKTLRFTPAVVVAMVGLLAAVILLSPITVSLDGYSHLYNAHMLARRLGGDATARTYFVYNSPFLPSWVLPLALAALSRILSLEVSLKLLILAVGMALVGALLRATDSGRMEVGQQWSKALLLLPIVVNGLLTLGFYAFLCSSAICILVLRSILRHGLKTSKVRQIGRLALLLAAYFFHPFPPLLSLLFPSSYLIAVLVSLPRWSFRRAVRIVRRKLIYFWPWAPILALTLVFALRLNSQHPTTAPPDSLVHSVAARALEVSRPDGLLYLSPSPAAGSLFLAFLTVVGTRALLNRASSPRAGLRLATLRIGLLLILLAYILTPDAIGDGLYLPQRILFYAILLLVLLSLNESTSDPRLVAAGCLLATLVLSAFAGEYVLVSRRMAPSLVAFRESMSVVPAGSPTLLLGYRTTPNCTGWPLLERAVPERHWAMGVAAAKGLMVLNDYEAATNDFPLRYRHPEIGSDVVDELDVSNEKKLAAWNAVLRRNDPSAEFVIVWGVPRGVSSCPAPIAPPLEDVLSLHYERIISTEGASPIQIWRRRSSLARP